MTEENKNQKEEQTDEVAHVHGPNCNHGHDHHNDQLRPITRTSEKIGRNDPCSCGSKKKFKKCCGK
jgi:uncharacterized protein YecA (UPF0149 family)